jgi:hypothetical protein
MGSVMCLSDSWFPDGLLRISLNKENGEACTISYGSGQIAGFFSEGNVLMSDLIGGDCYRGLRCSLAQQPWWLKSKHAIGGEGIISAECKAVREYGEMILQLLIAGKAHKRCALRSVSVLDGTHSVSNPIESVVEKGNSSNKSN